MSFPSRIQDGTGTKRAAKVTPDHALLTTQLDADGFDTPTAILTRFKLFRSYLKHDGSKDLNVDGSVNPVEFSVTSDTGKVLYVTSLRILINGTYFEMDTQDFRRFGLATAGGAALPNGLILSAEQGGILTPLFADAIQRTGDFMNYADDFTNLKNSVGAQEDFLSFDFRFESPVVLPEAVNDRVTMTVRDDLTPIDLLQVTVRGYQEVA